MPTDGMAASPLSPKGRDILLETGMVLKRIRHPEALGAKSGMHILWKRIHATYYVINGFRMDPGPDFPACPGHA